MADPEDLQQRLPWRTALYHAALRGFNSAALHWIIAWARLVRSLRRPRIIAITGSVGKTTTKEMLAAVLMQPEAQEMLGPVAKSLGNMNLPRSVAATLLGLPVWATHRELLRIAAKAPLRALAGLVNPRYPRWFILECGTTEPGTLRQSMRIAPPDIGVITNIGPSHLERLINLEGVAREKAAVIEALRPDGRAVIGAGHDWVGFLKSRSVAPVTVVGGNGFDLSRAIARAVARRLGLSRQLIDSGLAGFQPQPGRQRVITLGGMTVIDDSYNANPLSMTHGLRLLAQRADSRRVAILGSMAELGSYSRQYHRQMGSLARQCADMVIGVGEEARGYGADHWFPTADALANQVKSYLADGDAVLVKGSHSIGLNRVVERLTEPPPATTISSPPNPAQL